MLRPISQVLGPDYIVAILFALIEEVVPMMKRSVKPLVAPLGDSKTVNTEIYICRYMLDIKDEHVMEILKKYTLFAEKIVNLGLQDVGSLAPAVDV